MSGVGALSLCHLLSTEPLASTLTQKDDDHDEALGRPHMHIFACIAGLAGVDGVGRVSCVTDRQTDRHVGSTAHLSLCMCQSLDGSGGIWFS